MKINTRLLLIAALFALVLPLLFTAGNAQAAFLLDEGAGLKDNGQWQVIDPGSCLSDPAQTTRAACTALNMTATYPDQASCIGTAYCTNATYTNQADCNAAAYNWVTDRLWNGSQCRGNWPNARIYGVTGACSDTQYTTLVTCTTASGTWTPDYFGQSSRVQCLHCHNDAYGTHALNTFGNGSTQETYFLSGHKNVLRKVTDKAVGGGKIPLGGPYYTNGNSGTAAYTTVNWSTGMAGTTQAYYVYNSFFSAVKQAQIKETAIADPTTVSTVANTSGARNCFYCHTAGYKVAEARFPLASETMTAAVTSADALAKFEVGITCVTCHKGAGNNWGDYGVEHHTSSSLPTAGAYFGNFAQFEEGTALCVTCHRLEDTGGPIGTTQAVQDAALEIEELADHHGNFGGQFLQSPHARFTGTYGQIQDPSMYDSDFAINGNGCSLPQYKTQATCTTATGTWTVGTVKHNAGCQECHNPHVSAVDPDVIDPTNPLTHMETMCADCHDNAVPEGPQIDVTAINHPTGAKTPLGSSASPTAKDYQMACVRCHMGSTTTHLFKINTDAGYSTMPVQCSDSSYVSQFDCTSRGKVWTAAVGPLAQPAASGFAEIDLSWACGWCHFDAAKVGAGAVLDKTQLAAIAPTMHGGDASGVNCAACHTLTSHHSGTCTDCHGTATWPLHQNVTKTCADCHDGTTAAGPIVQGTNHHNGACSTCHGVNGGVSAWVTAGVAAPNTNAAILKPAGSHNPLPYWGLDSSLTTACRGCHSTAKTRSSDGSTILAIFNSGATDNHHGGHTSVPGTNFGGVSEANGSRGDNDPGMGCAGCHGKSTVLSGDNTVGYTIKLVASGLTTSTVAAANGRVDTSGLCLGCHGAPEVIQSGTDKNHHEGACVSCHKTDGTNNNGTYPAGVATITGGLSCTVACHTSAPAGHHSTTWDTASCEECHTHAGVKPAAVVTPLSSPLVRDAVTSYCMQCHNTAQGSKRALVVSGVGDNHHNGSGTTTARSVAGCLYCHGNSLPFGDPATEVMQDQVAAGSCSGACHAGAQASAGDHHVGDCLVCHLDARAPFPGDTDGQIGADSTSRDAVAVYCQACHAEAQGSSRALVVSGAGDNHHRGSGTSTARTVAGCLYCHGETGGVAFGGALTEAQEDSLASGLSSACKACHNLIQEGNDQQHHAGDCLTCHLDSRAPVPGDTDGQVGVSPLTRDTVTVYCLACHSTAQGSGRAIVVSGAGDNHHRGSGTSTANSVAGCLYCHGSEGGISFGGTDTEVIAEGAAGSCSGSCHASSQAASGTHHTGAGLTPVAGTLCLACHTPDSAVSEAPGVTDAAVYPNATWQDCSACHTTGGANGPANVAGHSNALTNALAPADCSACHTHAGIAPTVVDCKTCHGTVTGVPVLTDAQLTQRASIMHGAPLAANFTFVADDTISYKVTFTASGCPTGDTCTYAWTWGDGSSDSVGPVASKTYSDATPRTVGLVVTDTTIGATSDLISKSATPVSRNTAPTASKNAPVVTGMTVTVHDTSTDGQDAPGAMTATVYCGNGTTATGDDNTDLVCTYTTPGTYTITHSVRDTGGLSNSSAPASVYVTATKYLVNGNIKRANGTTAIPYAILKLQVGGVTKYSATSTSTGTFTFGANVLPGTYTLTITKAGITPAPALPAGGTITVTNANVTGVNVRSVE